MKGNHAITSYRPSLGIFCFVLAAFLFENLIFVTLDSAAQRRLAKLTMAHEFQHSAKPLAAVHPTNSLHKASAIPK